MTEETTGAEAPADEVVDLDADEKSDSSTEQQQDNETGEADAEPAKDGEQETGDDAPAKVPEGVQQRINELTRKRHEAERRAERAEKALQESRGKDFSDLDYEDQIAEKTLQRTRQDQAETDRATAKELAFETYHARVDTVRTQYPDFDQVAHMGWEPSPVMLEAILDSDLGPIVAYHLGKNPEERNRIAALNPVGQARELGRLEAKLSAPKTTPKTPPAPVKPVTGVNAGGTKDPSKMTMSEYIKWREANP